MGWTCLLVDFNCRKSLLIEPNTGVTWRRRKRRKKKKKRKKRWKKRSWRQALNLLTAFQGSSCYLMLFCWLDQFYVLSNVSFLCSTPTGVETPDVIDLRKQQRKEPEKPLYQVIFYLSWGVSGLHLIFCFRADRLINFPYVVMWRSLRKKKKGLLLELCLEQLTRMFCYFIAIISIFWFYLYHLQYRNCVKCTWVADLVFLFFETGTFLVHKIKWLLPKGWDASDSLLIFLWISMGEDSLLL